MERLRLLRLPTAQDSAVQLRCLRHTFRTDAMKEVDGGHEPLICAVCLEEIMDSETRSRAGPTTGCVHRFHWDCIRKWFQVSDEKVEKVLDLCLLVG